MPLLDQLVIGVPYLTSGVLLGIVLRDIRDAVAEQPREDDHHAPPTKPFAE